jgi:coenzyme PQQ precursor peptide PqqA
MWQVSNVRHANLEEGIVMAWTKPTIRELECGMEINMYGPGAEDDGVLF